MVTRVPYPADVLEKEMASAFEVMNARHPARFLARAELQEFQRRKLKELVSFAKSATGFYAKLYKNIDANNFSLTDLPIIDKPVVMSEFNSLLTDQRCSLDRVERYISEDGCPVFDNEFHVLRTSGTSGFRGIFVYDIDAWAHVMSIFMDSFPGTPTITPEDKLGAFVSIGQRDIGQSSLQILEKMGIRVLETYYERQLDESIAALNAYQPSVLTGYSYCLQMLCHEQIAGNLKIDPRLIFCGREPCSKAMKKLWKSVWDSEVLETYGASESAFIARECGEHTMHIFEDLAILEVVDEQNKPVPEGIPGHKILLTRLYNKLQPLIRYELPDSVILSTDPCPCGCSFASISKVIGKSDDIPHFQDDDGNRVVVHPNIFREIAEEMREVRRYRYIIHGDTIDINMVVIPGSNKKNIESGIMADMKSRLKEFRISRDLNVHFAFVSELPHLGTFKEKNIVFKKADENADPR